MRERKRRGKTVWKAINISRCGLDESWRSKCREISGNK